MVSSPTTSSPPTNSQAHCILSGESPRTIFDEQGDDEIGWMGATITLGPDSEAELDALLADGDDLPDSTETTVPSAPLGLPPLELVIPAATETEPTTMARHVAGGTLPQLVVEVQRGEPTARTVESVDSQQRPWLTETQPPLMEDISHLNETERRYFIQLEEEMRGAAIRHRRHVYRAAMESDRMKELRLTAQERFGELFEDKR